MSINIFLDIIMFKKEENRPDFAKDSDVSHTQYSSYFSTQYTLRHALVKVVSNTSESS